MTAADKLRELLATRPGMPNTEELVRWWRASGELVSRLLADVDAAALESAADTEAILLTIEDLKTIAARANDMESQLEAIRALVPQITQLETDLASCHARIAELEAQHKDSTERLTADRNALRTRDRLLEAVYDAALPLREWHARASLPQGLREELVILGEAIDAVVQA